MSDDVTLPVGGARREVVERSRVELGAVVPLEQIWRLARAWYGDPRDPAWRPRSRDENQSVLASVGLTGQFWELPP